MALTAARVQELVALAAGHKIKTAVPDPAPSETDVRLELDQTLLRGKRKAG